MKTATVHGPYCYQGHLRVTAGRKLAGYHQHYFYCNSEMTSLHRDDALPFAQNYNQGIQGKCYSFTLVTSLLGHSGSDLIALLGLAISPSISLNEDGKTG